MTMASIHPAWPPSDLRQADNDSAPNPFSDQEIRTLTRLEAESAITLWMASGFCDDDAQTTARIRYFELAAMQGGSR